MIKSIRDKAVRLIQANKPESLIRKLVLKLTNSVIYNVYKMNGWNHELPKGSEIRCSGKSSIYDKFIMPYVKEWTMFCYGELARSVWEEIVRITCVLTISKEPCRLGKPLQPVIDNLHQRQQPNTITTTVAHSHTRGPGESTPWVDLDNRRVRRHTCMASSWVGATEISWAVTM